MSEKASGSAETLHRVGGHLHLRLPVFDATGRVVEHVLRPLMVELRLHDVVQIVVGAAILAIPVGFTQEVWELGRTLPALNVWLVVAVSVVFVAVFVRIHFYRGYLQQFVAEYAKRVAVIYGLALLVSALLLTLIQQCPWGTDFALALRRVVIVALPASLSATVTDALK
jgi:uncharacterized membrane protein